MYELDSVMHENVNGGWGNVSNTIYGFLQGIPAGMYFGGKYGGAGGFLGGAIGQLIGVIGGGFVGAIGYAAMGIIFDNEEFENIMSKSRQVLFPGGTA